MKRIFTLVVIAAFAIITLGAQTPQMINYQSIIRRADNSLVTNATVGVRISILKNSESGSAVYVESHTTATNSNGLITIAVGNGAVSVGSFSSIDWANGPYFIKTEVDPSGGSNYTILGVTQILSVPYAEYAARAGSVSAEGISATGEHGFIQFNDVGKFSSDQHLFWHNSSKRLGLGIYPSLPMYKLDILHGGNDGIRVKSSADYSVVDIDAANGNAALRFMDNGATKWHIGNEPSSNYLIFHNFTTNSQNMRIESTSGNVVVNTRLGIGTAYDAYLGGRQEIFHNSNTNDSQLLLREEGDDYARLGFKNTENPNKAWNIAGYNAGNDANSKLNFWYNNGSQGFDVLSLSGTGKVTVVGNPAGNSDAAFQVNGSSRFGSSGVKIGEMRELTIDKSYDIRTSVNIAFFKIALPAGYTKENTRVLSCELYSVADGLVYGLGSSYTADGKKMCYVINNTQVVVESEAVLGSNPCRVIIMKVEN